MSTGNWITIALCAVVVAFCVAGVIQSHRRSRRRQRRFNGLPRMEWSEFLKSVTTFTLTEKMVGELCLPEPDRYMTLAPMIRPHFLGMEPFVLTPGVQRWMAQNCGPWGQVPHVLMMVSTRDGLPIPACVLWFANPDDAFNFKMRYG